MNARKTYFGLICAGFAMAVTGLSAMAQTSAYPNKPIRVLHGTVVGGSLDIVSRLVLGKTQEMTGWSFVIDSQPGGNGLIAVRRVASAAPDGYTLYTSSNNVVLNQIYGRFDRDIRETLTPIALMVSQPNMLFVNQALPVGTATELIAYMKKNPGKLSYGSTGVGTNYHLAFLRFLGQFGLEGIHIPYKGGAQGAADLVSGNLNLWFGNILSLQLAKSGKIKMLAVATLERLPIAPDAPTIVELGVPDFDISSIFSLFGPRTMAPSSIAMLNKEVYRAIGTPEVSKKLEESQALVPPPRSPADLRKAWLGEHERLAEIIKKYNIKPEE